MIPLGSPSISESAIEEIGDLLARGILSTGEVVCEFEDAFSSSVSRTHGVGVVSGSVALELALEATFNAGDVIAVSPYNCGSVLYSVLRAGLKPLFVDVEPETAAISPEVLDTVDEEIDGVLLTHLFGRPAAVAEVLEVARHRDTPVVEDFAQAPGATIGDEPIGSFGRVSVCSFGATKNLTTAEGGMVVTDDEALADYVAEQRTNTDDVTPPPRSVRLNDIEAALGLSQLATYEERLERKRSVAAVYHDELTDLSIDLLPRPAEATCVYHAFPVMHHDADALAAHLRRENVGTNRLYDELLYEYEAAPSTSQRCPVAEQFADEVVLLPIHGEMTDTDARTVASTVRSFCANQ